jgi:hypothetical protein
MAPVESANLSQWTDHVKTKTNPPRILRNVVFHSEHQKVDEQHEPSNAKPDLLGLANLEIKINRV